MPLRHACRVLLLAVPWLAACGAAGEPRVAVRDSAGVAIVTNHAPTAAASPVWHATETLRIGALDGADSVTFGLIEGVAVDADGRLYVLDQQARRVKVYAADGTFLRFIGRGGEGPGELSRWASGILIDDHGRVLVPDYAQNRVNAYDPDGTVLAAIPLPPRPFGLSWALDRGRLVYRGQTVSRGDDGRFAFSDAIVRLDTAAAGEPVLDTLLVLDYPKTDVGGPGAIRVPLIINSPFWDVLEYGRIAWGHLESAEIRIHGADGRLERIVRSERLEARGASSADHEVLREGLRTRLATLGGDVTAADGPNVVVPDSLPAITAVRRGPDGTMWVQRMGAADAVDPMAVNARDPEAFGGGEWDVFDADGAFLGVVRLPARFRVLTIARDAVYGVHRDELDVQRLVRYRLDRVPS